MKHMGRLFASCPGSTDQAASRFIKQTSLLYMNTSMGCKCLVLVMMMSRWASATRWRRRLLRLDPSPGSVGDGERAVVVYGAREAAAPAPVPGACVATMPTHAPAPVACSPVAGAYVTAAHAPVALLTSGARCGGVARACGLLASGGCAAPVVPVGTRSGGGGSRAPREDD